MLNIKFREEEQSHPLQALCPWIDFITPELVLNKDGSLLAAFKYRGVDPDNLNNVKVAAVTARVEDACKQFDKRVTAWWIVDKRRDHTYPDASFQNETAAQLDRIYSQGFREGRSYSITYTLYLLFTGDTGTSKFLDRVQRIQADHGSSLTSAFMTAVRESISGRKAFARDVGTLKENIFTFERIMAGFLSALPLTTERMTKHNGFDSALATLLNRASDPVTYQKPEGSMLDSWAPANYVNCGPDTIQFTGNTRTVYAAVLGAVKWPEHTTPLLFESLAALDMELTICQIVRFLNSEESTAAINEAVEYYKLTQYGLVNHAVAKASSSEPTAKAGKSQLLEQCNDALERIGAVGSTYAHHNLSVFVYGNGPVELNRNITLATQKLSFRRFGMIRERINALPSFAAMLPGQWALQTRYDMTSSENVADCAPIYTMTEGSKEHEFFSDKVYFKSVPNFATFGNRYGGRAQFSPHVGQVGHMLVVAPTGGGKTTFVNFCISQFHRYGKVSVLIFDRNNSCKVVTHLHDGTHVDIKSGKAKFNPLSFLIDGSGNDGVLWVREFIIRRLAEGGFIANAEDRLEIDMALDNVIGQYNENGIIPRLSTLAAMLDKRLERELGEWLEGRPYGMFDSAEDDFSTADWTTVEMKDILAHERLARAFIDYAFRKIYLSLDGTPTFIYLEEASFLFSDPRFKEVIDDWLKTFRKKNAFIWMTIQSPESLSDSDIAKTILDNIFSFLMCYNEKTELHRETYKKNFALEEHHVDLIAMLRPKRDYLLIQTSESGEGTTSRILSTHFSKEALAYLRSEETVLKIFDRHYRPNDSSWKAGYLAEVAGN
jgi:type IV secretion/conjugal transfer VirB4 family ATPase